MNLSIRASLAAAALFAIAGQAAANATHDAFVDVAGAAATDGFNQLVNTRITRAQLGAGIASNSTGSDQTATLQRLTGGFYPASFGLYSWSTDSAFAINVASAAADLATVTLQSFVTVDTSQGVDGLLQAGYLPTLSFNGGTQQLAATSYSVTPVAGGFDMEGNPLAASPTNPNYGYFSWDLSAVTTPITSFSVKFGLDAHASALAFQLDQSVAAPVPEPGTYALMLAGMGALTLLARRRKGALQQH